MTNLFIADRYHVIRDSEKAPLIDGMVEVLDTMLTDNQVQHYFSLPIDPQDDEALNINYAVEDEMKFFLVYALWLKTVRKISDESIKRAMLRYGAGDKDEH